MNNEQILSVGTTLRGGDLTVVRQLSSGGFGNTYVVRNRLDKVFAMKEFFIKGVNLRTGGMVTVSVPDNKATFESQRAKFEKEAKRLSMIDNPHIVKVHDLFYENGTVYYTMDYIDGESLADRMKRTGKPLSEEETTRVLRQVLDALSCVHTQHPPLLHLDLKPANIMVDKQGNAYLIDFGSSKQIDSEGNEAFSTSTGFTYTQGYAPVEQMMGVKENIGPWTDFYALGATLYNLLSGKSPKEINVHDGEDGFDFPGSVSPKMRRLIVWMMNPNRKKRPQFVRAITDWIEEEHSVEQDEKAKQDDEKTELGTATTDERNEGETEKTPLVLERVRSRYKHIVRKTVLPMLLAILVMIAGYVFYGSLSSSSVDDQKESVNLPPVIENLLHNMVYVDGGTFTMGATSEQGSDADSDEKPVHQVTLSSFSIGRYEVTQEEWQAVMGSNPSGFKGAKLPVERVSWEDCQEFIRKLNSMTGKHFRLPTEAEWEYAARGGNKSRGYKYAGSNDLGSVAWYDGNSGSKTHDVGQKQPNELGLYDMSGNVWEWCQDWSGSYSSGSQTNPTGPSSGSRRVGRGGSWYTYAGYCRVAIRFSYAPGYRGRDLGLRLVLQ